VALEFLRRRLAGDYEVDDFGFDRELTEAVCCRRFARSTRMWFRTEVTGAENIPRPGRPAWSQSCRRAVGPSTPSSCRSPSTTRARRRGFLRLLGVDLVFSTPIIVRWP